MKRSQTFLLLLAASLLAAALTETIIYVENTRARNRAEDLLVAVRQLRVGESTFSDTKDLRIQFHARKIFVSPVSGSLPQQGFQIFISNFPLNNLKRRVPSLWRLGLRPWAVEVDLRYQEEKLIYLSYVVDTPVIGRSGEPLELIAGATVGQRTSQEGGDFNVGYRMHPSSFAPHAHEIRFGGSLTPTATQQERDAAFDFNLSCLSSVRGCQALCEIMPSVWREALRMYNNKEMSLPAEELENPKCSEIR
jgi:hypothetical protein